MYNKINRLLWLIILLVSLSSYAMDEIKIWDELSNDSAELGSVILGAAQKLASIKKSGELFISKVEKRPAGPRVDIFRIAGVVLGKDGLAKNDFGLAIARTVKIKGWGYPESIYDVHYKETSITNRKIGQKE